MRMVTDRGASVARRLEAHEPDDLSWATGERRFQVLEPLARSERTTADIVDAAARELGIERAQCYRLLRRLRADPTLTMLVPRSGGRPVGVRLLGEEIEAIVAAAIGSRKNLVCQAPSERSGAGLNRPSSTAARTVATQ